MATLKGRAQHKLFALRKTVRLTPLSIGDAYAILLTVMRSTTATLYLSAVRSKEVEAPVKRDSAAFENAINDVITTRDGSIYAAFVTAVDEKHIFRGDRFAVSLARLGVTDELRNKVHNAGFPELANVIALKAPWFWAEHVTKELDTVRKEVSTVVTRVLSRFTEEITPQDIDNLLETELFHQSILTATPKVQIFKGADSLEVGGGNQQIYLNVFRRLAQSPRIVMLDQNSSLDGMFTTFHQHLMTDVVALQRLLPGAKFSGKRITSDKLQRIFKDKMFIRRLKLAFEDAYESAQHSILVDRLYRAMRKYSVHTELARAAKTKVNLTLNDDATLAIVNGIVGLFYAFAGDMKGQSFPVMQMLKGQ